MSAVVHGYVDAEGQLTGADEPLSALQKRAGGKPGGALAIPQLARLARLSARLGTVISRGVTVADGSADLDLWVRVEPEGSGVRMALADWSMRPARPPHPASEHARTRDFLRSAADWLWECDAGLNILSLSPGAERLLGTTAARMRNRSIGGLFRLLEGASGTLPLLEALARQQSFEDQQVELREPPGGRFRLAGVPLIDGEGHLLGFSGSAMRVEDGGEDVNAGRNAPANAFEERLNRALRAPLDRIVTSAEGLRAAGSEEIRAEYREYAGDIAAAGRHLLSLVDDLVDLQAVERPGFRPELEEIDLADLARRAAGLLAVRAADRAVRVERPAAGEQVAAVGEFRRTLQILVNLIGNAIRHSPAEGTVIIRAERHGDVAAVVVADGGPGIAVADQARIFDKFVRLENSAEGGSGLGLYIARRLARAMGGELDVDSAPGEGARFVLTLPAG